jgi:mannosyltransferase OCH1-like enzyme
MNAIPRIANIVWPYDVEIPVVYKKNIQSWKHINGWKTVIWTRQKLINILQAQFPPLLGALNVQYRHPLQLANICKYVILYTVGGWVIDPNIECLRTFNPLLDNSAILFQRKQSGTERYWNMAGGLTTYITSIMASRREEKMWHQVMAVLTSDSARQSSNVVDMISETTGDRILTLAMHASRDTSMVKNVLTLPADHVMPMSWTSIKIQEVCNGYSCLQLYPNAWAIHHPSVEEGSRWKPGSSGSHWISAVKARPRLLVTVLLVLFIVVMWKSRQLVWKGVGFVGKRLGGIS